MKISRIIEEANELADRYNLKLVEIDKTDNIINLKFLEEIIPNRTVVFRFAQPNLPLLISL